MYELDFPVRKATPRPAAEKSSAIIAEDALGTEFDSWQLRLWRSEGAQLLLVVNSTGRVASMSREIS